MGLPGERVPGTEDGPRKQIRLVIMDGADIADRIFPARGPGCLVTQHGFGGGHPHFHLHAPDLLVHRGGALSRAA
jgi:hypothetical protein